MREFSGGDILSMKIDHDHGAVWPLEEFIRPVSYFRGKKTSKSGDQCCGSVNNEIMNHLLDVHYLLFLS